ncbi:hypothetical protein JCM10207_003188 [Rhodosporidiobolus poonsookiae]
MNSSPDSARQRHLAHPAHPPHSYGSPADMKDPYLTQPTFNGAYANGGANGSAYRPRSPGLPGAGGAGEQGTLSSLLATLYRSAQSTFSAQPANANNPFNGVSAGTSLLSPKLSASSSTAAPPASLTSLIPSASTVGFVLLCSLWYLSSAFSSNTGKSILTRFRYPVTLTFVQFAFVSGYSLLVLVLRAQVGGPSGAASGGLSRRRGSATTLGGWGVRKPSRHMFHGTFMMSLFQIAGHVFSSMAIARVPVSTVHTIKALSPLFTVISYAALFGVRYTSSTYVALLPLTLGVMLACSFNIRANAIGFLCALGSTFIFVAQNIFSKKLLPKENKDVSPEESRSNASGSDGAGAAKLDKLNLLFYSSGMAFFLMIPIWLYSDFSSLFLAPASSTSVSSEPASTLLFYFLLNGTVHFAQCVLAFSLLARTSPVTYSIASLVKRIAVICIAIVWSHQQVSLLQAVGMTMTFGGLWMYNSAKGDVAKGEKKRVQAEKRAEMSLPTTLGDARALDGTETPPPRLQSVNGGAGIGITLGGGAGPISPTSNGFPAHHHASHPHHHHHQPPAPPPHHSAYSVHPDDPYGGAPPPGAGGGALGGAGARNRQLSQGTGAYAHGHGHGHGGGAGGMPHQASAAVTVGYR